MSSIKGTIARKAVKSTAKHSAHGTASKLRRDRPRAAAMLALGAMIGGLAGWLAGRGSGAAPAA
jgi:hypothetical protein